MGIAIAGHKMGGFSKSGKPIKGLYYQGGLIFKRPGQESGIFFLGTAPDRQVNAASNAILSSRSTSVGEYALFSGGNIPGNYRGIDAYTYEGVKVTSASLAYGRSSIQVGSTGDYAIFAGGQIGDGNSVSKLVEAIDANLMYQLLADLPEYQLQGLWVPVSVGGYCLLAGGYKGDGTTKSNAVYAYNSTLTLTLAPVLSTARQYAITGASYKNYAVIIGGYNGSAMSAAIDIYSETLTKVTAPSLPSGLGEAAAAVAGDYLLLAGGVITSALPTTVNVLTPSLAWGNSIPMPSPRQRLAGVSAGEYAVFVGGNTGTLFANTSTATNIVEYFDHNLLHKTSTPTINPSANVGVVVLKDRIFISSTYSPNTKLDYSKMMIYEAR
jgi:hypothetical protein